MYLDTLCHCDVIEMPWYTYRNNILLFTMFCWRPSSLETLDTCKYLRSHIDNNNNNNNNNNSDINKNSNSKAEENPSEVFQILVS